ncbi:MAG: protein-glutamate O-methyltransferase CheR [Deltaproteobacteria bacterium]|nr:MAG: protein-glutamate O-methyltransferase CheR [Deltaproteobacteria bacterium]
MIKVTPEEIKVLSKYVADISGIFLDQSKAYLIESRLGSLVEEFGCTSYREFYFKAKSDASRSLEKRIIEAIATYETSFFRDTYPFELLKYKILPDLIDKRREKSPNFFPVPIRIWSAACSTGQEVYSIAIVLKELLPDLKKFNVKILGTDISGRAIARASYGEYNKFEIERGLSEERLQKYFSRNSNAWKIKDEIRTMATFKKQNLMKPFTGMGKFDIIFCRNVAIYFTPRDRVTLFNKIGDVLEPDGYLIIGSTESLASICPKFEPKRYLRSVFYQLRG